MKKPPNFYNDLDLVEKEIIEQLVKAAHSRKSDFHTPVLTTVNKENKPNSRTVVLRNFLKKEWVLVVHSDVRSNKIEDIKSNPNICMAFYDKKEKMQLRVSAKAEIQSNHNEAWEKLSTWSRRCYLSIEKPGLIVSKPSSGFEEKYSKIAPSESESLIGKENFCCLVLKVDCFEWLYLDRSGHRRAMFNVIRSTNSNYILKKAWIVP